MHLIYYSHSYRDKEINEFFQELMLREGLLPSLDPPSDRLNAAKPERHLRSTDGMVAVLPYRDPEPSKYIPYEIALCLRAHKPVVVFVEDVLPSGLVPSGVLQRRFSRRRLLREVRDHRHTLQMLKTYIGSEPPPAYHAASHQRSCLLIGGSSLSDAQYTAIEKTLRSRSYDLLRAPATDDCLSCEHPYEGMAAQSALCVSFIEDLAPSEFYLLGATRAALTPGILLTRASAYEYKATVPPEYQPRKVSLDDMNGLCATLETEIGIFEEDYLELKEQDEVRRYREAVMQESTGKGAYSPQSRDVVVNIVESNIGGIDMSKDKISVSHVVGPVNIKSRLEKVTQVVKQAPAIADDKKLEFTGLIEELKEALRSAAEKQPEDAERVAQTAELVATELSKETPNKGFLAISAEGLKEAAKAVQAIAPTALAVAAKIAAFISAL